MSGIHILVWRKDGRIIEKAELERLQKDLEGLLKEQEEGEGCMRPRRRRLQFDRAWAPDDSDAPKLPVLSIRSSSLSFDESAVQKVVAPSEPAYVDVQHLHFKCQFQGPVDEDEPKGPWLCHGHDGAPCWVLPSALSCRPWVSAHSSRSKVSALAPGGMKAFSLRSHGFGVPRESTLADLVTSFAEAALAKSTKHEAKAKWLQENYEWCQWKSHFVIVVRRRDEKVISKGELRTVQKFLELLLKERDEAKGHRRLEFDTAWTVDEDVPFCRNGTLASKRHEGGSKQASLVCL